MTDIEVGDKLSLYNGDEVVVKNIQAKAGLTKVYNFTVADLHTFFVGDLNILVHNSPCDLNVKNGFYKVNSNGKFYIGKGKAPRSRQSMRAKEGSSVEWFEVDNQQDAFIYEYLYMKEMGFEGGANPGQTLNAINSPGKKKFEALSDEDKAYYEETFKRMLNNGPTETFQNN